MDENLRLSWRELIERIAEDLDRRVRVSEPRSDWADPWLVLRQRLTRYAKFSLATSGRVHPHDVDDLVQRLLLKMQDVRIVRRILESRNVTAYMLKTVANEARGLDRRRDRESDALGRLRDAMTGELSETPTVPDELPAYLQQLPPEDRRLLALRFWGNLSVQEVAHTLGITYSAAAVRYFRIFHRLRAILGPHGGPDSGEETRFP